MKDQRFIEVNEGFTKVLGYSREEVIGKTALDLNLWKNPKEQKQLIDRIKGFVKYPLIPLKSTMSHVIYVLAGTLPNASFWNNKYWK